VRADRLLSLVLLLQARGRTTALVLAAELEVSVRTVYRDLEALASRPRLPVTLRASPRALAAFGEIFGQAAGPALETALPPDERGWRVVTLSFEHERAAAHRLAGFGDQVEVLGPPAVRDLLVTTARKILCRYRAGD
jgi:predicted DNA-binding transcriptional regulator YafY